MTPKGRPYTRDGPAQREGKGTDLDFEFGERGVGEGVYGPLTPDRVGSPSRYEGTIPFFFFF